MDEQLPLQEPIDAADAAPDLVDVEYRPLPSPPENGLAPSLERRRLRAYLGLLVSDVVVLLATFFTVSALYFGTLTNWPLLEGGMNSAYMILPLYLTVALYNGTYSRRALTEWQTTSLKAIGGLIVAAALLNLLAFFAKSNAEFSRLVFAVGLLSAGAMMVLVRIALVRLFTRKWGPSPQNKLVILAGGPIFALPHAIHVDAAEHGLTANRENPQSLDRLSKYLRHMDEVIVSCTAEDRAAWSDVLKGTGLHGEVIHQLSREIGAIGVVHHDAADISSLKVSTGQLGIRARAFKRIFDVAVSSAVLVVLSPLMLCVALLIKLEDGGPVFFVQRRMGRGNEFFDILKFRSMREGDASGDRSTAKDDQRITRIGRFIRRTSIDELPQLINVLKGEMSLVGPRPHALGSKAGSKLFWQVDRKYWQRHGLRPGITGLAQVRGYRGATETEAQLTNRLLADLEYMQGWSLWRDVTILVSTLRVLVHERAF
ncbi:exopolysaccharide biosynthesis polyprenyl glycosylphosphotransferase [Aurantiacibacter sp. D1-12]|uniref:exopolysaccharide biosynthesis polyprenyl glycosylphosphotransferase n=1 Tax=Aurantiacibacter sp. D1-12 TaxID=2993658 RepID=UPI00237D07B9|nr:exopolysaccharide biosynthesis polyprenyl glycosylphosphotransferase [Aurantiacibacter sp. D1-12]MDE1468264.1 exopolysaccharide biosynthesis polyprenyl glycosylphosphotransferase [Aurantiacibacter sp. D1-12]